MASIWTPTRLLNRAILPGEWILADRGTNIAIIKEVIIGKRKTKMFRAVTYNSDSSKRTLIGYFPFLDMAAEVVYREYLARFNNNEPQP